MTTFCSNEKVMWQAIHIEKEYSLRIQLCQLLIFYSKYLGRNWIVGKADCTQERHLFISTKCCVVS